MFIVVNKISPSLKNFHQTTVIVRKYTLHGFPYKKSNGGADDFIID